MNRSNLHICHSLDFGGITTFVNSLVDLNCSNKITHHILVWQKEANGQFIIDISAQENKKEAFEMAIKNFDKLFVHSLKPFMLSALKVRKEKVFLFQHGLTFGSGYRKIFKRAFYFTVINRYGFKVVCSSEFAQQKLLNNVSVFSKDLIKTIPFGVNLKHKASVSKTTETIRIGFVGRLVGQKRVALIFNALKSLECTPNIEFKIAGTGPQLKGLKQLAGTLQKEHIKTQFKGHVKNISKYFSEVDILILPSVGESYGLVVLEAFFNNVPVIVFQDTGACVEFIHVNENGFIVDDVNQLSSVICQLSSVDLRRQLKSKIRTMDLSKYHISNTKSLLDEL